MNRRACIEGRMNKNLAGESVQDIEPAVLAAEPDDLTPPAVPKNPVYFGCVSDRLIFVKARLLIIGTHAIVPHVSRGDLRYPLLLSGQ